MDNYFWEVESENLNLISPYEQNGDRIQNGCSYVKRRGPQQCLELDPFIQLQQLSIVDIPLLLLILLPPPPEYWDTGV